ncbi:hypothetical protein [Sandarakinorhabdus oryzae]|uniref:hypothetical protein n=1 Tax=Sandarakinorhabdus oryzae TaxID=2675220 RepID=UPI0012E21726|nr:hypothetical protein [Sandarakinorhabdus oryzae]
MIGATGSVGRVGSGRFVPPVSGQPDFALTATSVTTVWGVQTVGTLTPVNAPAGAYFVIVEDSNPSADYAGLAVVNG